VTPTHDPTEHEDEREERARARRREILLNLEGDLEKLTRAQAIHKLLVIREFLVADDLPEGYVRAKGVVVHPKSLNFPCTWDELREFLEPPAPLVGWPYGWANGPGCNDCDGTGAVEGGPRAIFSPCPSCGIPPTT